MSVIQRVLSMRLVSFSAALIIAASAACSTSPTGRRQLTLLPTSQMNQMGEQAFDEYKRQKPIEKDPAVNAYVKCVANAVAAQAKDETGVKVWDVVVFRDKEPNAFALPGGNIGVHTGILPVARTPGQLAAVLGHEVGHVIAEHGNERVSQGVGLQIALTALQYGLSDKTGKLSTGDKALLMAAMVGSQVGVLLPFSRTHESEADRIGLELSAKAGFNPEEAIDLWKNMSKAAGGGAPPEFLSTHPSSSTRIEDLQRWMPDAKKLQQQALAAGRNPNCRAPSLVFHN